MWLRARKRGSRAAAGAVSPSAMLSGTFQYGLNTMVSIVGAEERRLALRRADDHLHLHHRAALLADRHVERRHVHQHVPRAEIVGQPPPAFEVERDAPRARHRPAWPRCPPASAGPRAPSAARRTRGAAAGRGRAMRRARRRRPPRSACQRGPAARDAASIADRSTPGCDAPTATSRPSASSAVVTRTSSCARLRRVVGERVLDRTRVRAARATDPARRNRAPASPCSGARCSDAQRRPRPRPRARRASSAARTSAARRSGARRPRRRA